MDQEQIVKEQKIEISFDSMAMSPDSRFIYQPRYVDEAKTRVKAIVRNPDGSLKEMEDDKANVRSALIRDVFAQYSEAELEMFTHRENMIIAKRRELEKRMGEDLRIEEERERTFQAKARAMEMPEVIACTDKELVRRIRRAKNSFEVAAWTAVVLQKGLESGVRVVSAAGSPESAFEAMDEA